MDLKSEKCKACTEWTPAIKGEKLVEFLDQLDPSWEVVEGKQIERRFRLKNFQTAMDFLDEVGKIAEEEGHHPDLCLHNWNKVRIGLMTHKIKALSENDFIVAAKIDRLWQEKKEEYA